MKQIFHAHQKPFSVRNYFAISKHVIWYKWCNKHTPFHLPNRSGKNVTQIWMQTHNIAESVKIFDNFFSKLFLFSKHTGNLIDINFDSYFGVINVQQLARINDLFLRSWTVSILLNSTRIKIWMMKLTDI